MRKIIGVLVVVAMAGFVNPASALTTDGDWSDWFAYNGTLANIDWLEGEVTMVNDSIRTLVDEEGPTPGVGGQLYDIEQIFYYYEDADPNALSGGRLHIGMVTGFPAEGVAVDQLYAGDMFIDFGNHGGGSRGENFDVAIATSKYAGDAGRFGNIWHNDGLASWATQDVKYPQFGSSNPYRVNETVVPQPSNQTANWNPIVAWGTMGVHNFLEISFDVAGFFDDALTNKDSGGIGLHWTMECGNDVINVSDDVCFDPLTPLTTFAPVPEPSTFILLGMGTLGALLRKRFTA